MKSRLLVLSLCGAGWLVAAPLTASFAAGSSVIPPLAQSSSTTTSTITTSPGSGMAMDDSTITDKVKAAISADRQASGLNIDVNTSQGVVVVSGTVPSSDISDHVLQLVASVNGVRDVRSELRVQGAS